MPVDPTKQVLYLGMATDIISPFHLIPDFETLYVINCVDPTYGNIEEHKEDILSILLNGNDKYAKDAMRDRSFLKIELAQKKYKELKSEIPFYEFLKTFKIEAGSNILEGIFRSIGFPATNIHVLEQDDELTCQPWHITFKHNGIKRHLYYYFDLDFNDTWPSKIKNIGHVIWIGANCWDRQRDNPESIRMMETRTIKPYIYASEWNHSSFPDRTLVPKGYDLDNPEGEIIAIIQITDFSEGWWDVDMDDYEEENE